MNQGAERLLRCARNDKAMTEQIIEDEGINDLYPELQGASLPALRVLRKRANKLFKSAEKDSDKVALLEFIKDMEDRIRLEEYKERLLNGEE